MREGLPEFPHPHRAARNSRQRDAQDFTYGIAQRSPTAPDAGGKIRQRRRWTKAPPFFLSFPPFDKAQDKLRRESNLNIICVGNKLPTLPGCDDVARIRRSRNPGRNLVRDRHSRITPKFG
jgi:hypothetical protein